jgi:hypothetical protein
VYLVKWSKILRVHGIFSISVNYGSYIYHQCLDSSLQIWNFFFIIVILGVYCDIYKKFLKYHSWFRTLHHSPLSHFIAYSQNSFNRVSFFHLHTCAHNICTIFILLHSFFTSSQLLLVPTPTQELLWHPILRFCKKRRYFCLFKIAVKEFPCNISMYIF